MNNKNKKEWVLTTGLSLLMDDFSLIFLWFFSFVSVMVFHGWHLSIPFIYLILKLLSYVMFVAFNNVIKCNCCNFFLVTYQKNISFMVHRSLFLLFLYHCLNFKT